MCFTNRLEETACKTGTDQGHVLIVYTVCYRHFFYFTSIHTNMQIISSYWFLSGGYLHNWLIHVHAICSSTHMYMKNVNDVTGWLSQTIGILKYFVWSPGLWDIESRLYMTHTQQAFSETFWKKKPFLKRNNIMLILGCFDMLLAVLHIIWSKSCLKPWHILCILMLFVSFIQIWTNRTS